MVIKAGVDTAEHAHTAGHEMFQEMLESGCIMVPTLEKLRKQQISTVLTEVKAAYDAGIRIVYERDARTFNHRENARDGAPDRSWDNSQ